MILAVLASCKQTDKSNSSLAHGRTFYKLERCQKHLCVRSIIKDPNQYKQTEDLKTFDSIKIQSCDLQSIPQIKTATCKTIKTYKATSKPTKQFSLKAVEQQNLIQENALLLDEAISKMNGFVEESLACEKSGQLHANYGSKGVEYLGRIRHEYVSILGNIVPIFHAFLSSSSIGQTPISFNLSENADLGTGILIKDRIDPNATYYLEVRKFEPKLTIGIDFSWYEFKDVALYKLADIQNTIKEMVGLAKDLQKIDLKKLHEMTVSSLQVAKDLWTSYPVGTFHHVGVAFSPRDIIDSIDQFAAIMMNKGQYTRVEHPTIDPIKYAFQIFHGHTLGHLGTAVIGLGDIRRYANAGLGAYTSLAYVVRKGGKNGPVVDSFVYPYRREDHGLLSLEELETLYKGDFSVVESSESFKGQKYINFLEQNKDHFLDEVARANLLEHNYQDHLDGVIDKLTPPAVDINKQKSEKFKGDITEKVNSYITALDSAREFGIDTQFKRGIIIVAVDQLNFQSTQYQKILLDSIVDGNIFTTKDLESFTPEEIEKVYQELLSLKTVPDGEYAKYINSDLYKLQERLRSFEGFNEFFKKIVLLDKFDRDILIKEFLAETKLNQRASKALAKELFPVLKDYREVQHLGLKENLELDSALKVQMKYDFLTYAVTEYGYENKKLEEISEQRKFSILSIFGVENKNLLSAEKINEIFDDFIKDQELGRYQGPAEGATFDDFVKSNEGSLKFKVPQLYLYHNHIKSINFDDTYRLLAGLSQFRERSEKFRDNLIEKIGPESSEASNQILQLVYKYNPEKISLSARGIYSELEKQNEILKGRQAPGFGDNFDSKKVFFDVELFKPTLDFFINLKNLATDIQAVSEPTYKAKINLTNTNSCKKLLETTNSIEPIFVKLKEKKIFIDFLSVN